MPVFLSLSPLLLLVLGLKLTSALYQNVEELLGGDGEVEEDGDEEGASLAQSTRSLSPVALNRPPSTPDLVNTDGTLMLFPGNSCSHTAYVCGWMVQSLCMLYMTCVFMCVCYHFSDGIRRSGPSGQYSSNKLGESHLL